MENDNNPLVSVVIPTYNRADVISEAIDSVLNQTYKKFELIIIDDGSKDNTVEILEKYADKIKYFYQENTGESSARNFSIQKAKGKYISFLDSDDIWLPERLEKIVKFLEENKEYSAAISEIEFIDRFGKRMGFSNYSKFWGKQKEWLPCIINHQLSYFSNMTVKMDAVSKIGFFDTNLKTAADIDYFLRIGTHYKIGLVSKPLLRYRKTVDSLSHSLFTGNRLRVIEKFKKENPDLANRYKSIIERCISKVHLSYAEDLLCTRHIKESQKEISKSFKINFSLHGLSLFTKSLVMQGLSPIFPKYKDRGAFIPRLPLVSVIIPAYNGANFVKEAIDSVLTQTYKNIELIVVDDGSTDTTKEEVTKYKNQLQYFYIKNSGNANARNFGISKATGEYIAFLDHDDKWFNERLEKLVVILEKNLEFGAIISEVEFTDRQFNRVSLSKYRKNFPKDGNAVKYLLNDMLGLFSNLVVRKSVVEDVGQIDEELKTASDIDYFLRISVNNRITLYKKPLLKYRKNENSLSNTIFSKKRLQVLEKFIRLYPELAIKHTNIITRSFCRIHLSYAEDLMWNRYLTEAVDQIKESFRYYFTLKGILMYNKIIIMRLLGCYLAKFKNKGKYTKE